MPEIVSPMPRRGALVSGRDSDTEVNELRRGLIAQRAIGLVVGNTAQFGHQFDREIAREDIICADKADGLPVAPDQEISQCEGALVQRGPGVDRVLRIFEPLVDRRVEQRHDVALDQRQRGLARCEIRAAEEVVTPLSAINCHAIWR